jgi:CHAT domain-containing protein
VKSITADSSHCQEGEVLVELSTQEKVPYLLASHVHKEAPIMSQFQSSIRKVLLLLSTNAVFCGTAIFFIFIMAVVPACTTRMSLEEAKRVTLSVSGKSFVPPPRRIDDITKILDQRSPDPETVKRLNALADASPPTGASIWKLTDFYYQRGMAAKKLGRSRQSLIDFRKAAQIISDRPSRTTTTEFTFLELALAELRLNNYRAGIESAERARKLFPKWVGVNQLLVNCYSIAGDLENAERAKNRALDMMASWRSSFKSNLWSSFISTGMTATILEAQGQNKEAEPLRRRALRLSMTSTIKSRNPGISVTHRRELAENLREQNRLVEAEMEARQALLESIRLSGSGAMETRKCVEVFAIILSKEGRHQDADQLLRRFIRVMQAQGIKEDSPAMGWTRYALGEVFIEVGNWSNALENFRTAQASADKNLSLFREYYLVRTSPALALLRTGHPREGLELLQKAHKIAEQDFGIDHHRTSEILGLLAVALFDTGKTSEAFKHFSKVVPDLLESGDVGAQQRKLILERYIELLDQIKDSSLEREAGINAVAEAFRIAGALQAQSVQYALAQSLSRAALNTPEMADLVRGEQDTEKQIHALETLLSEHLAAPADQQYPEVVAELRESIKRLRDAHKVLLTQVEKEFPEYAELINPPPATVKEVQERLSSGEVMISIYPSDSKTYLWAIQSKGNIQFVVVPIDEIHIKENVELLRKALSPDAQTFGEIPEFNLTRAFWLYANLLSPLESSWKDATDLIIVASGSLSQLPFTLLPTAPVRLGAERGGLFSRYRKVPWLIRAASIARIPAPSSFVKLRKLPKSDPTRKPFLGFGDPLFNRKQLAQDQEKRISRNLQLTSRGRGLHFRSIRVVGSGTLDTATSTSIHLDSLHRLPDTADEIKSIAKTLDANLTRDVFLGEKASESHLKAMELSDRRVIAFATHALVPGDLDGLNQPALALSSPSVTGEKEDGLLTMEEIFQLKLDADWVVLSACNTGAAEGAGAEAVSGLGRAFFYAGSRAILVSMWPVETTSAKKLTTGLFRYQRENPTLPRARLLRKSILDVLDGPGLQDNATDKIVATYAHPLFWAPFVIVGDSGKGIP